MEELLEGEMLSRQNRTFSVHGEDEYVVLLGEGFHRCVSSDMTTARTRSSAGSAQVVWMSISHYHIWLLRPWALCRFVELLHPRSVLCLEYSISKGSGELSRWRR